MTNSKQLPPPVNKDDWWGNDDPSAPEVLSVNQDWPRITIVTPTFNQGRFIETTIRSVLLQRYPNLEYIVVDGGSTDGTVEIIKKYEPWLTSWVSERDRGPAHAINKGLALATGEWFNWLNSDDFLLPGALKTLASIAALVPQANWISGGRINVTIDGLPAGLSVPWLGVPTLIALGFGYFHQDATFIKRRFLMAHGAPVDENLRARFDTALHRKLLAVERPCLTTAAFSAMRWYPGQLTSHSHLHKRDDRYIQATKVEYPLLTRMGRRMLKTRLKPSINAAMRFAAYHGWLPESRRWQSCRYNRWKNEFEVGEARHLLLKEM